MWISWYLEEYSSATLPPAITFLEITIVKLHLKVHYFILELKKILGKITGTKMKDNQILGQMLVNMHDE